MKIEMLIGKDVEVDIVDNKAYHWMPLPKPPA